MANYVGEKPLDSQHAWAITESLHLKGPVAGSGADLFRAERIVQLSVGAAAAAPAAGLNCRDSFRRVVLKGQILKLHRRKTTELRPMLASAGL